MFSEPTNRRRQILALLVSLALAGTVLGAAVPATAQELPGDETETPQPTQVTEQLGDLVIHDYSYDGETMKITATWRGDLPTTLTLTEMIEQDSAGATEISFKQVRLVPGEQTEIEIALEERSSGTAAALLTTPGSVENANALVLQSGDAVERGPIPFGTATVLVGLAAVGGAGMAFALTARSYRDDDQGERRERIA